MGVTIDSIQVEIESSSTKAAKGIDALAKSLEGLKKNGSFKTVSTNLNNLSTALNNLPNVHRASNSLRTLANSIEQLKGVGSVASLSNSLKKLPEALKAISNINLEKTEAQLEGVARAVSPLSNIKAGGLSTMVNSMKNLGKVTESLDDETIKAFAKKIELLNEKLGPFAEKMSTVKSAFSAINSKARSAAAGTRVFDEGVDATALNLSSFIEVARTAIDTVMNLVRVVTEFMHNAMQWDGIEYQFGNAFGEQADMYYEKITKITDALRLNKQMFMENSAMATSMLVGFGVNAEDAREMGVGYTQLAYDIWAAFNNVYENFEGADGAMAAVRSAIAGEVEPIRRAGFTIVESQLEQTAANHGLKISIESATEAQKSYLRYLELVDQAHRKGIVGTYASEMETAEGLVRTLKQQWVSLTQAVASLFIPILVKIVPYIQAIVELLTEGVHWLAKLLGVEIQAVDFSDYKKGTDAIEGVANSAGNATGALNDATEAAKELKNATLGIDELNVISPPSAASSGGSGGSGGGSGSDGFAGLDVDSLWDETIFDTVKSDVDAIKEKLKGWLPAIASVASALAGLRLVKLLDDINAIEKTKLFAGKIKGLAGWTAAFTSLAKEGGILATLAVAFPKISKALKNVVGNFGAFISLAKEGGVVSALAAAFPKLSTALSGVGTAIAGISAPVWAGIAAAVVAVGSAIYFVVENWDELKRAAKEFFAENIVPKFEEIGKHFEKIKEAFSPLKPIFDAIGDFFKSIDWDKVKDVLGKIVEGVGALVVALSTGLAPGIIQAIVGVFENLIQVISGTVQAIAGIFDFWVALFTGGDVLAALEKMYDGIGDIFGGLVGLVIDPIVDLFDGVVSWFTKLWDILVGHSIVPDTVDAIVEWFTSLPSKIFSSIENFVTGIVDKFKNLGTGLTEKFSSAWEAVKTWWSKKTSLSTYTPSIGKIWENLKSAWETAKTWWSKNRGSLSTYTPSIGKIWEKLKTAWTSAKDWWNKSRSALSYTPSIGSISSKLSSAWTTAKNWWNKSRSSLSYTPSIGSIKDKIVSAWNTAKKWWSSNASLSTKLNISVPKLTVNWGEVSALGKTFKYPKSFSVKFAADGGIFNQGSLIWAGERGPEVMATAAGGKTGVMNVQQMQESVYEGVYAAMVAALRGMNGGGGQEIKVYIDGKEVSASVKKHQHESGASIMGNEVYSY